MNQQQKNIIDAAFSLFREKGYEETTTREIAAKANIQKGLLYYYFHKKEDIVFLWYRNFLDSIYEKVQKSSDDNFVSLFTFLFVYYQTLESDDFALSLIYCVLTHHDLTKRKVLYTSDFYTKVLPEYNKDNLFEINAMLIGGESQLLPMIIDHEIGMTIPEFAEKFVRMTLNCFHLEDEQAARIYKKAKEQALKYQKSDYERFVRLDSEN